MIGDGPARLTGDLCKATRLVLVLGGLLGWGAPCAAQEEQPSIAPPRADEGLERAKELQRQGVAAFRSRDYQAAIDAFLQADRLVPSAALSFNVGRAYAELGDVPRSLFWYSDYLRRSPEAADAGQVRRLIAEREAKLASRGEQLLIVRSEPSGAAVEIDGSLTGSTPCALVLPIGNHDVVVTQAGRVTQRSKINLQASAHAALLVEMAVAETPPPPPAASSTPAAPHAPFPERPPASDSLAPNPAAAVPARFGGNNNTVTPPSSTAKALSSPSNTAQWWAWGTLAVGGVGVATAAGFELARRAAEADAETARVQLEKQSALERNDRYAAVARWTGAIGGLGVLTSGLIWLLDSSPAESASHRAFVITPKVNGVEVNVVGETW